MAGRLDGKVALVMGAGSIGPGWGNGKATATLFAREGARVVCADIKRASAEETAAIIRAEGGEALAVAGDAVVQTEVRAIIAAALQAYGQIDILDNNVGIVAPGGVVDCSEEEWDRVMDVNVKGAFLTMKHVIPLMAAQGGGSIINISSIAAIRHTGVPYAGYYASKAALSHLTRTTAYEWASRKVRVNAILPGLMKTPMVERSGTFAAGYSQGDIDEMWRIRDAQVPMGHMGDAFDVARAAVFLASDDSRYITGIELIVDGGITLKYN